MRVPPCARAISRAMVSPIPDPRSLGTPNAVRRAVEALEDAGEILTRQAHTAVGDLHPGLACIRSDIDGHPSSVGRGDERIAEQIRQHLCHSVNVCFHGDDVRSRDLELNTRIIELRSQPLEGSPGQCRQVARCQYGCQPALLST